MSHKKTVSTHLRLKRKSRFNTELAGLIDDVKIEEAKVKTKKLWKSTTPVNAIPNAEEAKPKTIGEMFQKKLMKHTMKWC